MRLRAVRASEAIKAQAIGPATTGSAGRPAQSRAGHRTAGLAQERRDVYVLVGDGSYLMLAQEIVTSIQEDAKMTIVLVDNDGFSSIGSLSRSVGADGFGTMYRYRRDGSLGTDSDDSGARLPVDLAANAASLGAHVLRAETIDELRDALETAKSVERTVVIHIPVDRYALAPSYETWSLQAVRSWRMAS